MASLELSKEFKKKKKPQKTKLLHLWLAHSLLLHIT